MKPVATPIRPPRPAKHDHEELVVTTGERSGATIAVAVHSTVLGPALGGLRLWHYPTDEDGVADALRLARGMTFKAAAAGLNLGGGKGVICAPSPEPPRERDREALLLDFGDLVHSLEGRYITAEDVGTAPEDMVVIARRTPHVTGLPPEQGGTGDPSPFTALGVQAAMRAAAADTFGTPDLAGLRVVIAGLGHVGQHLARGLVEAGAQVTVTDIDLAKRELAEAMGAAWAAPAGALERECEILSPCAVGGAIHAGNVASLGCRIICGAANNQLADESLALELAERGIVYAPDFIANAGGIINVYRDLHAYSAERATELALGIQDTTHDVLAESAAAGITPLEAARRLARQRLSQASRA